MLGVLLALCAAASWGTDAVLARQGLRRMPPAFGTLVSLCASVVGAVVVALLFDREHLLGYPPAAFAWFALIGLVNFLGGRQCNYEAVKRLGAARATPIFAASPLVSIALSLLPVVVVTPISSAFPLFTVVLVRLFLRGHETVNRRTVLGALCVVAGVILVTLTRNAG